MGWWQKVLKSSFKVLDDFCKGGLFFDLNKIMTCQEKKVFLGYNFCQPKTVFFWCSCNKYRNNISKNILAFWSLLKGLVLLCKSAQLPNEGSLTRLKIILSNKWVQSVTKTQLLPNCSSFKLWENYLRNLSLNFEKTMQMICFYFVSNDFFLNKLLNNSLGYPTVVAWG